MRCMNACTTTHLNAAHRAQWCAVVTSVWVMALMQLFAMCSRNVEVVREDVRSLPRPFVYRKLFVNIRCRIHSLYTQCCTVNSSVCVTLFTLLVTLRSALLRMSMKLYTLFRSLLSHKYVREFLVQDVLYLHPPSGTVDCRQL